MGSQQASSASAEIPAPERDNLLATFLPPTDGNPAGVRILGVVTSVRVRRDRTVQIAVSLKDADPGIRDDDGNVALQLIVEDVERFAGRQRPRPPAVRTPEDGHQATVRHLHARASQASRPEWPRHVEENMLATFRPPAIGSPAAIEVVGIETSVRVRRDRTMQIAVSLKDADPGIRDDDGNVALQLIVEDVERFAGRQRPRPPAVPAPEDGHDATVRHLNSGRGRARRPGPGGWR